VLPGPACWGLNANSACDTGEDRNENGVCDPNDFQGPPGAAPVGVYDRNNLRAFLAIILQFLEGQKIFEIQNIY
jgi:hypothetical protein